jgi:hypothetical protein
MFFNYNQITALFIQQRVQRHALTYIPVSILYSISPEGLVIIK